MVRVNAEVEEEVRSKWKEHSQQGDKYANMTHLIRTAVENQIRFDNEFDGEFVEAVSGAGGSIDEEMEDLKQDLNETLISLQSDINSLQVQTQGTENETLLSNLMSEFHDTLTLTTFEAVEQGESTGTHVDEILDKARSEGFLSPDMNEIDARKALEKLAQDVPNVESLNIDGERHYFEME